jgi:hypothetical protein
MHVDKAHPFWGWLCITLGLFPILMMSGVLELDQSEANAPVWVIVIAGVVFVLAGLMILTGQQSRFTSFCAVLLCACFGLVGAWVSFAAPGDGFSGGIPFAPREFNIALARWVFGIGSLMSFGIAYFAFTQIGHKLPAQNQETIEKEP